MTDQLVPTPLWKHQQEEITRLSDQPRVLICWDMGTGKTLGAVERDLRLRRDAPDTVGLNSKPTLVVAPMNTHESWEATFKDNTDLRVRVIDRKARERFIKNNHKYGDADVYIMHYDVLRLMPELVGKFGHGIFDECQKLSNRGNKWTKAAKHLAIPFLTDMSGTPADKPQQFWSVLNHLKPKTYSSYWRHYHQFVDYVVVPPQGYHKIVGPYDGDGVTLLPGAQAWQDVGLPAIQPFYTRVLKDDVLDLPPKTYTSIYVDLTPQQRKQYNEMKQHMLTWLENVHKKDGSEMPLPAAATVSQLQRLQMFALGHAYFNDVGKVVLDDPSSKCDAIMQILEDNPNEQLVVFSQFKGPLRILKSRFQAAGITYGSFTGDDAPKVRAIHKRRFIEGTNRVLLGTIGSGGVGVDGLQHACCSVVFLDRAWSPPVNRQAEDRLHRGGQTRTVQVIDIIARDTVDLGRHQKLKLKAEWIKIMLGDK
jgi:SNF2 family DNA or RNA helicase